MKTTLISLISLTSLSLGACLAAEPSGDFKPRVPAAKANEAEPAPAPVAKKAAAPVIPANCRNGRMPIEGAFSDYKTVPGPREGVQIAIPSRCGDSWSIKVRGTGFRVFAHKDDPAGNLKVTCAEVPEDPSKCPRVLSEVFVQDVKSRFEDDDITVNGVGVGPCGTAGPDPGTWDLSIGISDWRHADQAVEILVERMKEWNLGDTLSIALRGAECGARVQAP